MFEIIQPLRKDQIFEHTQVRELKDQQKELFKMLLNQQEHNFSQVFSSILRLESKKQSKKL